MLRYAITGPLGEEAIDYGSVIAACAIGALHKIHAEASGYDAVDLDHGEVEFSNPDDQLLCPGSWRVKEFARSGNMSKVIEISPPVPDAV